MSDEAKLPIIDDCLLLLVSPTIPSVQDCHDFCASDASCGAVATFVGTTRNHFQGKPVVQLSYEGYIPMALKELRRLCHDTATQFPVQRIAAVHIIGDCPVGHASVILAASSPHRKAAIQAIEYLIDQLKARIPIWKREVYENDESVWKENPEWHQGKQRRVMVKE